MKKQKGNTTYKRTTEVPAIISGFIVSLVIGVILTLGMTSLLINGTINESGTANWVFVIRTVACALGCLVSMTLIKKNYLLIVGTVALSYLMTLIAIGIIVYDSSFNNILAGTASVLLGGGISCLTALKPLKKSNHVMRYRR